MLRLTAPAWRAHERVPKLGGYGMVFHLAALLGETTTGSPGAKPLAPSLSLAGVIIPKVLSTRMKTTASNVFF